MKLLMRTALAALFTLALVWAAYPATLLPNGEQQFTDNNGLPLTGGSVYFYIPNTTTLKNTFKDPAQTILNSNPVVLDGSGRAIIYGSGSYSQKVLDQNGNLIWNQLTADTSGNQSSWGGTSGGSANAQTVTATNFSSQDGQAIAFIAGFSNTGATTLNPNGIGPINIVKATAAGLASLSGGEIVAGNIVNVVYTALTGQFQMLLAPAGQHVFSSFTSSGSFAVPSTTTTGTIYHYRCVGAGGGGGGSNGTAVAGGGGSGAYAEGTFTGISPGSTISLTIGAAGAGGSTVGTNGTGGGGSIIGAPVSVTCGGGNGGFGSTSGGVAGGAGGTATGTTPNIVVINGQAGYPGLIVGGTPYLGGQGGATPFGAGGAPKISGAAAGSAAGQGYGSGGGGGLSTSSAGSAGAGGLIIIDYVL